MHKLQVRDKECGIMFVLNVYIVLIMHIVFRMLRPHLHPPTQKYSHIFNVTWLYSMH